LPLPVRAVQFGPFQLDLGTAELRKNGSVTKLANQPFQILAQLVQHPGELVTRDELRQRLWQSDTFVDFEYGLNAAVRRLREVLGDSAENPTYIETLPRRGYRLIVPVESPVAAAPAAPDARVRRWKAWLAAAAVGMLVVVVTAGLVWRHRSRGAYALTPSDTILIADFTNTTGDAVFDDALKQGLTMQLEQSPFLNIVSQTKVQDTLRLMERGADERLTLELGRELCQRVGAKALLTGSIARLDSQFVIGVTAMGCSTGGLLVIEQEQAAKKDDVLKALGKAASELRSKLGESLSFVQTFDVPIEEVTTPSLEALKAYSLGVQAYSRDNYPAASALFQRAITLDPNFAMAYGGLATIYSNQDESLGAYENIQKAYDLRGRVSDRERLYITSTYQHFTGDLASARRTYEMWEEMYPRDWIPSNRLAVMCDDLGDREIALASFKESLRRNPTGLVYGNLVDEYLELNRLEDAKATAIEAHARQFDNPDIHIWLYMVAFLERDTAGMEREADAVRKSDLAYQSYIAYHESDTAAFIGQFAKARELTQHAASIAESGGDEGSAVDWQARSALREALVGNLGTAKRQARAALAISKNKYVEVNAALALGLAGDAIGADRLSTDLAQRYARDTLLQSVAVPSIRAVAALQPGKSRGGDNAIRALEATGTYELALSELAPPLFHLYIRGLAFLDANQAPSAAIEFQKILDHPGIVQNNIIGALAHLQIGRAYAMSGDTTKAKAAYQDFLTLWKDADPGIPILKEARSEYAKLQ